MLGGRRRPGAGRPLALAAGDGRVTVNAPGLKSSPEQTFHHSLCCTSTRKALPRNSGCVIVRSCRIRCGVHSPNPPPPSSIRATIRFRNCSCESRTSVFNPAPSPAARIAEKFTCAVMSCSPGFARNVSAELVPVISTQRPVFPSGAQKLLRHQTIIDSYQFPSADNLCCLPPPVHRRRTRLRRKTVRQKLPCVFHRQVTH